MPMLSLKKAYEAVSKDDGFADSGGTGTTSWNEQVKGADRPCDSKQ
jgi:hypothetical protein